MDSVLNSNKLMTKALKKISQEFLKIHYYNIVNNFEEELQKIKNMKLDIVFSFPFHAKIFRLCLIKFSNYKIGSFSCSRSRKIVKTWKYFKNENLIFSNSKGAYSYSLGEIGKTSMMYFSYNLYSYTEFMKNKEWSKPRKKA